MAYIPYTVRQVEKTESWRFMFLDVVVIVVAWAFTQQYRRRRTSHANQGGSSTGCFFPLSRSIYHDSAFSVSQVPLSSSISQAYTLSVRLVKSSYDSPSTCKDDAASYYEVARQVEAEFAFYSSYSALALEFIWETEKIPALDGPHGA